MNLHDFLLPSNLRAAFYYVLRDRIPVLTLGLTLLSSEYKRLYDLINKVLHLIPRIILTVSLVFRLINIPSRYLFGFQWAYAAPILYSLQIIIILYYCERNHTNGNDSTAIAYHAAAYTGYLHESAYVLLERLNVVNYGYKVGTPVLLSSSYTFLLNYQLLALPIFFYLLYKNKYNVELSDYLILAVTYFVNLLIAFNPPRDYAWVIGTYTSRLPFILYSIYVVRKK